MAAAGGFAGGGLDARAQASGDSVSRLTLAGMRPATTSARVISSTTERMLARRAIQTTCRFSAAPSYSTSSGASPRTLASGPSTARITAPSVTSAAGLASQ